MSQPNVPGGIGIQQANLQIKGGAALIAPASAFPTGIPQNALVLLPVSKPPQALTEQLKKGAVVVEPDKMWELLGFRGQAVQVQDAEGKPITIGLEDLLDGLEQHWNQNKDDLNRGRLFANELMKYNRAEKASKVLAQIVAKGGTGEDWLGLGVAQLAQEQFDKAESTLKGAQNLAPDNPFPSLHLARVYKGKKDPENERKMVERAIGLNANLVDAWAYLYSSVREAKSEDEAVKTVTELADQEANKKSAAPFVALQGFYSGDEKTRDKAIEFAKKGVERNSNDSLALVCLSALYGQRGDLPAVITLLSAHEAKMMNDVRLANNYFEALFQAREIEKVTKLLNALAGSPNREVKQFAVERSRMVAVHLQKQQQQLRGAAAPPPKP